MSYQTNVDLSAFRVNHYRSKYLDSSDYFSRMGSDNLGVMVDPHIRDALHAQGFSCEDAPRSIYRVEKLFEALRNYAPDRNFRVDNHDKDLKAGIALAYSCFAKPDNVEFLEVLPMTPETIAKVTSNPSGSSGLTAYGVHKADSQYRALERGIQVVHGEKAPEPCIAFKRTQFDEKTRLIWGYPYDMTFIEGLFAKPLLDRFKMGCTPMAFAIASGALGTRLVTSSYHCKYAYCLDMSQFDSTVSSYLIKVAFNILRTWFPVQGIEPISKISYNDIWEIIVKYFIHTPIVMPDHNVYKGKKHGVPSGSFFTQMIDSIVNTIMVGMISRKFHLNVSRDDIFVLGDDVLLWSNTSMSLNTISKFVSEKLGLKVHGDEKSKLQHYDEVIHFLGREWDNGMPGLDIEGIIQRMIFPESHREYSSNPEEVRLQVYRTLLGYAATYLQAWRIAHDVIVPHRTNHNLGTSAMDPYVYDVNKGVKISDAAFSGLYRYRQRYINDQGSIPTDTALQYWL